jgi:hypothetical protein
LQLIASLWGVGPATERTILTNCADFLQVLRHFLLLGGQNSSKSLRVGDDIDSSGGGRRGTGFALTIFWDLDPWRRLARKTSLGQALAREIRLENG